MWYLYSMLPLVFALSAWTMMASQQNSLWGAAKEWMANTWLGQAAAWMGRNSDQSFGGQLAAMGREMVRDIRGTFNEVMWGRPEGIPEPGAPLSPTPQIVTGQLLGKDAVPDSLGAGKMSLAEMQAAGGKLAQESSRGMGQEQDKGHEGPEM